MGAANQPGDTHANSHVLKRYSALDMAADEEFNGLTALAIAICRTRMGLICLIEGDRQWVKSAVGWETADIPAQICFCLQTVSQPDDLLIVPDAAIDARFATDPLVVQPPYLRFYAGVPLFTSNGVAIGTLCTFDPLPHQLDAEQVNALWMVGRQVMAQLELRAKVADLERTVTRQRRVERVLSERNRRFRLTLRELKQTQAQLIQTEKMSSLGQMVAGVAHEINNPVSFVYGNLTYVNRYIQDLFTLLNLYQKHYPQPDTEIQQCMEAIDLNFLVEDLPKILSSMKVGADRIRQIVLSLRNFSRLDEAEKKPVDIHQGIDNTLLILQHRLKATVDTPSIEVIKEYGKIPPVECYAGQLNQVFMNILSNAIDAIEQDFNHNPDRTSPRHNQITIRTAVVEDDLEHARVISAMIHIIDNGPGIPEEARERVFDPFFTTKPVGKGTGLGLSISYQIVVERHGGTLECQSELGVGTQFCIKIPIRRSFKAFNEADVI